MPVEPLFSCLDRGRLISLAELAKAIRISERTLRRDAQSGLIPGAVRKGPKARWYFERDKIEQWWQELNFRQRK